MFSFSVVVDLKCEYKVFSFVSYQLSAKLLHNYRVGFQTLLFFADKYTCPPFVVISKEKAIATLIYSKLIASICIDDDRN